MESVLAIPHYPPLPFPAPLWLLQTLLVMGLFLHTVPMNMMFGGTFLSAFFLSRGMRDKSSYAFRIGKGLAKGLPIFVSFAVTQGIVPLLFLQLIYGPMYYTSSVLMAVPWLSLLGFLLCAYGLSYVVVYMCLEGKRDGSPANAPLILVLIGVLMLVIGFIFVNNMTLMLHPERWLAMYQHSAKGMNLNLADEQIPSRYCHFILSALAVGGLTVGSYGLYFNSREPEFGNWLIRIGARTYGMFTFLNVIAGVWFMLSLPRTQMHMFIGDDKIATGVFALSMVLAAISWLTALVSSQKGNANLFKLSLVSGCLTILAMIVNRHELRTSLLSGVINPDAVPVQTQRDLLSAFVISAGALIIYLVWISKLVFRALSSEVKAKGFDSTSSTEFAK